MVRAGAMRRHRLLVVDAGDETLVLEPIAERAVLVVGRFGPDPERGLVGADPVAVKYIPHKLLFISSIVSNEYIRAPYNYVIRIE